MLKVLAMLFVTGLIGAGVLPIIEQDNATGPLSSDDPFVEIIEGPEGPVLHIRSAHYEEKAGELCITSDGGIFLPLHRVFGFEYWSEDGYHELCLFTGCDLSGNGYCLSVETKSKVQWDGSTIDVPDLNRANLHEWRRIEMRWREEVRYVAAQIGTTLKRQR